MWEINTALKWECTRAGSTGSHILLRGDGIDVKSPAPLCRAQQAERRINSKPLGSTSSGMFKGPAESNVTENKKGTRRPGQRGKQRENHSRPQSPK